MELCNCCCLFVCLFVSQELKKSVNHVWLLILRCRASSWAFWPSSCQRTRRADPWSVSVPTQALDSSVFSSYLCHFPHTCRAACWTQACRAGMASGFFPHLPPSMRRSPSLFTQPAVGPLRRAWRGGASPTAPRSLVWACPDEAGQFTWHYWSHVTAGVACFY